MKGYQFGSRFGRVAAAATLAVALFGVGSCSLGTEPDSKPTSAKVNIEGTFPNPLTLVTSIDFYEQLNTETGVLTPILITSDTVLITSPYEDTIAMGALGSVYVELYQPEVETATVHMKVSLDNGEGYEQNATLADKAQLIYYFVFTNYSF